MIIVGKNISYSYPEAPYATLKRVDFILPKPGLHALFGPSGVGKTSLAKILSGAIKDFDGELELPADHKVLYTHNQEALPGWSNIKCHFERISPEGFFPKALEAVPTPLCTTCLSTPYSRGCTRMPPGFLEEPFTREPLAWAIRKGDPDFMKFLNEFLAQIKTDGCFDAIYDKWFRHTDCYRFVR